MVAQEPLPPFPASIKDGYAVLAEEGPGVRRVRGEASAGCSPKMEALVRYGAEAGSRRRGAHRMTRGEVIRINTGAPLPPGADAVVMVEDTKLVSGQGSYFCYCFLSRCLPPLLARRRRWRC